MPGSIAEAGTPVARELWESADDVVSTRLLFVEAAAALARARRTGRMTDRVFGDTTPSTALPLSGSTLPPCRKRRQ
jgi:hypothetical protein